MPALGAILLAAGGSTRMGAPKQLLRIGSRSLLRRAAETALAAGCEPVVVVLGCDSQRMLQELEGLPVQPIVNEQWEAGIGTSIRRGVEALKERSPEVQGMVLLLCDQPFVTEASIRRLIDARQTSGKPVCACAYAGTIGPPVLVDRSLFPQLLTLPDSQGAKALWTRNPKRVCESPCEEAGIDVDTPEDYQRLLRGEEGQRRDIE